MNPAMIALVVAIAGMMLPAISFTFHRDCDRGEKVSLKLVERRTHLHIPVRTSLISVSRLQLDAEDLRAKVRRGGDETERVVVVLVEAERSDLMRVII